MECQIELPRCYTNLHPTLKNTDFDIILGDLDPII